MERLTYRGSETMTEEDGWTRPSPEEGTVYSCYSTRKIIERLAEYEDLEEQGLLLRLPVKVGDTVYTIRYGEENDFVVVETKIIEIRQNVNGIFFEPLISRKAYKINDFGKEVFLTRAEAEQKLKEMESDNKSGKE